MQYAKIWDKVLNTNEEVKYEFSVSEKYRKVNLGCGIALSIFILLFQFAADSIFPTILAILVVSIVIFRYWYTKVANAYALTNKRILVHNGFLSTTAKSLYFDKITEVSITERFLDRMFYNSGHMIIHTGNITDTIVLKYITSPYELKKKFDSIRHV